MKLLTRTTLYFTGIALLVFSAGGIVLYHSVNSVTAEDADERLQGAKKKIERYVKQHGALPLESFSFGDSVAYTRAAPTNISEILKDTILYNYLEKEMEPYRMLRFYIVAGESGFGVTLFKPVIEADDLRTAILESIGLIALLLLAASVISNFVAARYAWRPFYLTLEKLNSFQIAKGETLSFARTDTAEFDALNEALSTMTEKISSDYRNLKEFTENASHELQTPLSVIQSKLELLIQSQNLSPDQVKNVRAMYDAVIRLSRLNQALVWLAKIENGQLAETEELSIERLVTDKLAFFEELIKHKQISLEKNLSPLPIKANPVAVDMLVANLLSNAIKHNLEGGKIIISTAENKLVIKNSGEPFKLPSEALFQRFKKSNQAGESLGLGLAIVKEICIAAGYKIEFGYENGMHTMIVKFA